MKHNIWDLMISGKPGMPSGHGTAAAEVLCRWHARLAPNPQNPKWCVPYVSNYDYGCPNFSGPFIFGGKGETGTSPLGQGF